jgi:hypothetical protein
VAFLFVALLFYLLYIDASGSSGVPNRPGGHHARLVHLKLHEDIIMGFATHLGPWLLGTVKNTTGTTAGTIRNMGATSVSQIAAVTSADSAATQAFVVPAGAIITNLALYQTTTFTSGSSGTFTVLVNGTSIGALAITTGTAGNLAITASTAAMSTLWANVGSTDAIITYTPATLNAGAGVLVMEYIVRGSDGAANPSQV